MTTHCRTEMRCTVCVFSPSYYKILWLLWKREVAASKKWETIWRWRFIRVLQTDGLSMLQTFWLISQNKGSVKIRFWHCMRFSLTYFKKAAEHRGQCKSCAWCNYILYQNRIWGPMLCSVLFDCFPYCVIAARMTLTLTGEMAPCQNPFTHCKLIPVSSRCSRMEVWGFKWGAFQFRLLSSRKARSFAWKWITKHIVWFNKLPWACVWPEQIHWCISWLNWK